MVVLRKHGVVWSELELVEGPFSKTVSLLMRRPGESRPRELLTLTVVGDKLLYSTAGNQPVLGGKSESSIGETEVEHAEAPKSSTD